MIKEPKPEDYEGKRRDPEWERNLKEWLKSQPEELVLAFLIDLWKYQGVLALRFAHDLLRSRASFMQLLELGVSIGDASSIKYWLDCVVPRLGFRRTLAVLMGLAEQNPRGVAKAFYWLPRFAISDADNAALKELGDFLDAR